MNPKFDASRNPYIDLENIRITLVDKTNKPAGKDFAGTIKYLRVQSYRNRAKGRSLHRGAEFPLGDFTKVLDFVKSVSDAGKNYQL